MTGKKVAVAGATGLVGNAVLRHFGTAEPCEVVALSRRKPRNLYGARHVPVDLTSEADCRRAAAELNGATHLIYAALYEAPQLVDGSARSAADQDQRSDAAQSDGRAPAGRA
ncbi:NAD-dependent epimerase/dehydratase family protein [Bradyrhizobium japonicum]